MTISETLLSEFDQEMALTRRMLECVPEEKFPWKPHERSFTLGRLANHLATMPFWAGVLIYGQGKKPVEAESRADLLNAMDRNIVWGRKAIAEASDDDFAKPIPVGSDVVKSRVDVLRNRMMSHMIHHRGQLSVYLRLLDVSVPGMYGPSADEKQS